MERDVQMLVGIILGLPRLPTTLALLCLMTEIPVFSCLTVIGLRNLMCWRQQLVGRPVKNIAVNIQNVI